MRNKKAFTLAEILIAITIIGIIAVLTIPSLFEDTSASAYNTKFKSTFAQIQQGLIHAENVQKHPFIKVAVKPKDELPEGAKFTLDQFMQHHFDAIQTGRTAFPAGQDTNKLWSATYRLKNGAEIIFPGNTIATLNNTGCTNQNPCLVWIDVNGKKSPNQEVMCTSKDAADNCISVDESVTNDVFPIEIRFSHIYPYTNAVEYILNK